MWPTEIDHVFVLANPRREKARCERLFPHLTERGIPADRITVCGPTWGDELDSETIFKYYDPFCRLGMACLSFKSRCLSRGEISLVMNFATAAMSAIQRGFRRVIVFESDIWLREDFVERLHQIFADLKKSGKEDAWDYISLGEGARTRPKEAPASMFEPTRLYDPPHQFVYRCTDSMLFQVDYLKRIMTTFFPFRECLDWELNTQNAYHKGRALWADPPLVEQGTTCGRLATTLTA